MQSSRSLRTRALLALLLMVGFYVFALAIAGGLLWIPYAEYTYLERDERPADAVLHHRRPSRFCGR